MNDEGAERRGSLPGAIAAIALSTLLAVWASSSRAPGPAAETEQADTEAISDDSWSCFDTDEALSPEDAPAKDPREAQESCAAFTPLTFVPNPL